MDGNYVTDSAVVVSQNIIVGRAIKPPEQRFDLLKEWVRNCDTEHSQCITPASKLPTRVIDVGEAGSQEPLLKQTKGEIAHYMTLSHCWGSKPVIRTTKDTLTKHLHQLPVDSLPKTFRNAVAITRNLGIRYLWIDSLCIIQDDADDWERESTVMGEIYSRSYLTIAASASKDSSGGCFLQRPTNTHVRVKCSISDSSTGYVFVREKPKSFNELDRSKLNTRAWVAQERLLSPRTIHYDIDQIMWECKEARYSEDGIPVHVDGSPQTLRWDGRLLLSNTLNHTQHSGRKFMWDWYQFLENYTRRDLTSANDKLPALSGLATVIARKTGDKYVAGLWEGHLNIGMLWKRLTKDPWLTRPVNYRAPSWSWAAYDGPISWVDESFVESSSNPFALMLEDIQVAIKPQGLDANGKVAFGSIAVTSRLKKADGRANPESTDYRPYPESAGEDHLWDNGESVGWVNYDEHYAPEDSKPLYCLQMTYLQHPKRSLCHFLALRGSGKENEFRRIGQGCTGGGEVRKGWFEDAEKRSICIL